MYRCGYFRNLENELFKVVVNTNIRGNEQMTGDQITLLSNPFSIEVQSDENIYKPYKCSTATVRFLLKEYDETLNDSIGNNIMVLLLKEKKRRANTKEDSENDPKNYELYWYGYATPNAYNQGYNSEYDSFELECQDALSTLAYFPYKANGARHNSIQDYIFNAFDLLGLYTKIYWPTSIAAIKNDKQISALEALHINELNWFDEDGVPKNQLEVIEQICQFLGLSCVPYKDAIYFVDYDAKTDEQFYEVYFLETRRKVSGLFKADVYSLDKDDFNSNDFNLSVLSPKTMIEVTAKHYPISKLNKQKYNDMRLETTSEYGEKNQYGKYWQCIDDGRDSLHVQNHEISIERVATFNSFVRYNYFNDKDDYKFYSYERDNGGNVSQNKPVINEKLASKRFFYEHNAAMPCEFDIVEYKGEDNIKKINLKKAFFFQTAWTITDGYTWPKSGKKVENIDWTEFHDTIKQEWFTHKIGYINTTEEEWANIVNIDFKFEAFYDAWFPCRKLSKDRTYNGLLYQLRFGDLYYNSKTKQWQEEATTSILFFNPDDGAIIQETQNWKESLLYGDKHGLNVPLPPNMSGLVEFTLMRPYVGLSISKRLDIYQCVRYSCPCNVITNYETSFITRAEDNNDDSETIYENKLNDSTFIDNTMQISNDITTFDNKAPNLSSPYFWDKETWDISTLKDLSMVQLGIVGRAEELLITKYSNQNKTPTIKLEGTFKKELHPTTHIKYHWFRDKTFIINSYSFEVADNSFIYSFIEKKPLLDIDEVLVRSKIRNTKKNGDLIYHDENFKPKQYEARVIVEEHKPTNFKINNKGNIIMTI